VHLHVIDQISICSSRTEGNVALVLNETPRREDIWVTFACCLLHAGFLLGLLLNPKDGSDIFLRNVGLLLTDCTALCPRRWNHLCEINKSYKYFLINNETNKIMRNKVSAYRPTINELTIFELIFEKCIQRITLGSIIRKLILRVESGWNWFKIMPNCKPWYHHIWYQKMSYNYPVVQCNESLRTYI
jgi:hypothetical protein